MTSEAVIESLYEAVLDPAQWPRAMAGVAALFGSSSVGMWHGDCRGAVRQIQHHGFAPEAGDLYSRYYNAIDPGLRLLLDCPAGDWQTGPDLLHPQRSPSPEYVHDFAKPHGVRWAAGARLFGDASGTGFVIVQRPETMEPFGRDSEQRFLQLRPHLQRAALLQRELFAAGAQVSLLQAAIDQLATPMMVVAPDAELLRANATAERLLRSGRLSVAGGRLSSPDPQVADRLRAACGAACGVRGRTRTGALVPLTHRSQSAGAAFVVPLSEPQALTADWRRPLALVVVIDTELPCAGAQALWMSLFALSAAEAQVLALFVEGLTPAEIAERRATSVHTARSQLKSVMLKTGTRRQAQLMKLALSVAQFRQPSC